MLLKKSVETRNFNFDRPLVSSSILTVHSSGRDVTCQNRKRGKDHAKTWHLRGKDHTKTWHLRDQTWAKGCAADPKFKK